MARTEIFTCDKCGERITDVVYTVTCYAAVVNPYIYGADSAVVAQNLRQSAAEQDGKTRHLCCTCKDAITDGLFIV